MKSKKFVLTNIDLDVLKGLYHMGGQFRWGQSQAYSIVYLLKHKLIQCKYWSDDGLCYSTEGFYKITDKGINELFIESL